MKLLGRRIAKHLTDKAESVTPQEERRFKEKDVDGSEKKKYSSG